MGFFAYLDGLLTIGIDEKAKVVMEVFRHPFPPGNGVNIEVEDPIFEDFIVGNTGFFPGFFFGNSGHIGIAITMSAWLQP